MNARAIMRVLGILLLFLGATMGLPFLLALLYQEPAGAFLLSGIGTALLGLVLRLAGRAGDFSHREAFVVVAWSWMLVALLGGLPLWLSGALPTYVDGIFEAMSGVTTTGATVLTDLDGVPHNILFWRSFLHWIGGMGFVVLSIAFLPSLGVGGSQLFQAEVPGPVPERIRPRIRQTAAVLWGIYAGLSLLQVILLLVGGMNLFEAVIHTFSTMGTGGFSSRGLSVEGFANPYVEGVILVFMVAAGANFALHYSFVRTRSFRGFWRSEEFMAYLGFLVVGTLLVTADLWLHALAGLGDALRLGGFQVASIMTTTGFSSANFDTWPPLSRAVLLMLMFVGGCAGSTGGALKVVRVILVIKYIHRELLRMIHPRVVRYVTLDGKPVDNRIVDGVLGFVAAYLMLFAVGTLVMSGFGLDVLTASSAVAATLGNVGPGFGVIGPYGNYAALPAAAKVFLSYLMLVGRLEIFSVVALLLPQTWRRRSPASRV